MNNGSSHLPLNGDLSQVRHMRYQRGNALLYTMLALVVGGIGLAVGISQYQDAERSTSVQSTVGEINAIIGGAKQNFGQYNYTGLTTAAAVGSQIIPRTMAPAQNATTANNKFGGLVTLVDNNANTPGTALLTYQAIPSDVCTNIVNGTQGLARRVQVGNTDVKPLDGVVAIAALATQCNAAGAGGATIAWTIGRT